MRKFIVIFIVFIGIFLAACEPITHLSQEEMRSITEEIRKSLINDTVLEYYFSEEYSKDDTSEWKKFIHLENKEDLAFAYEYIALDQQQQYYYSNGILYSYNLLSKEKIKEGVQRDSMEFLRVINKDLCSLGKMLEEKYLASLEGLIFDFTNTPQRKNLTYIIKADVLYEDGILEKRYQEITVSVSLDYESEKILTLKAIFKEDEGEHSFLLETEIYNDVYETAAYRLNFPLDFNVFKER